MNNRFFGVLMAAVMAVPALAQNGAQSGANSAYSQYGLGILADQSQSFSRGMGGTGLGLRDGTLVNTLNPASYSAVDSLTMLFDAGVSGQFTNFKEQNTSLNSRSANLNYVVGLFRMRRHLGVSFGLMPFSDIGYSYTTSSYLNNSLGSISETFSGSGGIHQLFVGAGWNPFKALSLGVNVAYLWGNYNRSATSTAVPTVNSLSKVYKASINSYQVTLGLQWQQAIDKKNSMTLGATVGLGHKLGADPTCDIINLNTSTLVSDTTTTTIKNGLELPMSYGVGASWNHDKKLTLAADYTLQKWGSIDYPSYNETTGVYGLKSGLLKDRTRMSIGADYVIDPQHPTSYLKHVHFRAGASYTSPYYTINGHDGPKDISLTAGLSLPLVSKWNIGAGMRPVLNISAQWIRTSAKDLITENSFRINLGLTFNERWFAKWRID